MKNVYLGEKTCVGTHKIESDPKHCHFHPKTIHRCGRSQQEGNYRHCVSYVDFNWKFKCILFFYLKNKLEIQSFLIVSVKKQNKNGIKRVKNSRKIIDFTGSLEFRKGVHNTTTSPVS